MIFKETPLSGAFVVEPERKEDHRGFFARVWCEQELRDRGLKPTIVQSNLGFSHRKGTLRGLHFQESPHSEVKLVRCTLGAMFDVVVDLRRESPTYKRWFGIELTQENRKMIYVPEGFAQGYITLEDNTEMCYHTSQSFNPKSASGVRYNDPEFGIQWPVPISVISDQDKSWPDYANRSEHLRF
jgi:dTDP-4-dehydrorhamnose 3,5-epimerase